MRSGDDRLMRALDTKAMSYGSGQDGGYLVPDETEAEIGRRLSELSPIRSIASVRQVSAAVLKKPFAITGPAVGWVAETAARPQTGYADAGRAAVPDDGTLRHAGGDRLAARGCGGRSRPVDRRRGGGGLRRAGRHGLRHRRRRQQAEGLPRLHRGRRGELELGQYRLCRDRRVRRAAGERSVRHADRHGLCAEGRLPAERDLGDEPQDARRRSASSRTPTATISGSRRRRPASGRC